jgi:class 3 adenylate cyclase/tetratricopeptide (TPR) repeat protein
MVCSSCGAENRAGRRFCGSCGTPLEARCPACGTANEPEDRFCGACGSPMDAPAPQLEPAAERRMVSVLFTDLVGFTTHAEGRDPEDVRELLSRYFETARAIVDRHGGTIEKFIGDAVVAVWGSPAAHEDDAERSVRAAMELVAAVRDLGGDAGLELAARAGIATGETAVTIGAVGQGMVAGDIVNTAARIQGAARPGSVFLDEATRRASEAAIASDAAGTFELKGKAEPARLWAASRVVANRGGEGRAAGLDPPFTGRDDDLRLCKQLFHATAEHGRSHLLTVTGPAGIGKSRLAWEFETYVDGLAADVLWHRGRCLSYGDGVAFWALAEMVRMRARITEDDAPGEALRRLDAMLAEHVPDAEDRAWITPAIHQLLGLEATADGDRARLFAAWRLLFEHLAATSPAVLVFEDLQWADQALLDFLEYLLEWSRDHRLFVIALARPELADSRPGWASGLRTHTSIGLKPLGDADMRTVVEGMAPGIPADAVGRIVAQSEGIPLYAVETVRMLLDRGLLERNGDAVIPTGDIGELQIPETLHALVAARLDALPAGERRALQLAAVLGKSFTAEGLAAISGLPAGEVDRTLASLGRKELVRRDTDPFSPDIGQYGFVQAIARTIAYETLSRRDRKATHLAAAEFVAELGDGDELVEVVAAHRLDAYRLLPDDPDAPEIRGGAVAALERASARASSLGAPREALRLSERLLELSDDPHERARLLELAGGHAARDDQLEHASELFSQAIALQESWGDAEGAARAQVELAEVQWMLGESDESLNGMEQAYAVLSGGEPTATLGALAAQLGRIRGFMGDDGSRVAEPLDHALRIAAALDLPDVMAEALNSRGTLHLLAQHRMREGRVLVEGALAISRERDVVRSELRALFNLGFLDEVVDVVGSPYDRDGLDLARRIGDRGWTRSFLAHLTHSDFVTGDWDTALDRAQQLSEGPGADANILVQSAMLIPTAAVLAARGDAQGARAMIASVPDREHASDVQDRGMWCAGVAYVEAHVGDPRRAIELGRATMGLSDLLAFGHPATKVCAVACADAAIATDDRDTLETMRAWIAGNAPGHRPPTIRALLAKVSAVLDQDEAGFLAAEAEYRALGYKPWLASCLEQHANLLTAAGRHADAEVVMDEARQIYMELAMAPALERTGGGEALPRGA